MLFRRLRSLVLSLVVAVHHPRAALLPFLARLPHATSAAPPPGEGASPPAAGAGDFTIDLSTSSARRFGDATLDSPGVGFRCAAVPLARALGLDPGAAIPPAQITGFGPRFEEGTGVEEIVHHMDVFGCKGEPRDYTGTYSCSDPFMVPECHAFVAVYDKGAGDYHYPDDVGVAVGEGTGYTWFLIQTHYLSLDESKDLTSLASVGNSGFKVWFNVGEAQRPHNARFLGIMDESMNVPADAEEHAYTTPESDLQSFLQHDLDAFGNLTVFGGHLHAHDHCTGFYLDVRRRDAASREWAPWDAFGRIVPYGGYGPDQTIQDFGAAATNAADRRVELRGGEEIRVRCTWRTPHPPLPYGIHNGEEMCGPILLYYPTDAAAEQKSVAYTGPGRERGSWRRSSKRAGGVGGGTQLLRSAPRTEVSA